MAKTNVMHIIYSLHAGGAEEVIAAYARYFDRQKYKLSVLVITDGGPLVERIRSYGVPVYLLQKKARLQSKTFLEVYRAIRRESVDIVHAHNPAGNNWGLIPAKLAQVKAFIRTEHNVYYYGRVTKFYPIINYILSLFNDRIIACSDFVRQSHIRKYHLPKRKLFTIKNGIVSERFQNNKKSGYLQQTFGIPQDKLVVGTVGALIEQKGHEYLLDAAQRILLKQPDTYFLIVGDGKRRAELEALSHKNQLKNRVIFTGLRQDIPEILNAIDVFVLSSLWEGLPIVILEAMSSKTCVIATDVGGNSEAIIDGQTGFLVPPRDSVSLAEKTLLVLQNVALRTELANRAYKFFQRNFTAQQMVQATEALYQECIINCSPTMSAILER